MLIAAGKLSGVEGRRPRRCRIRLPGQRTRSGEESAVRATSYQCGEFRIDTADRRFSHRDREIPLEPRVLAVITELLARAGSLITRNELLDAVWGHRYVTPSTLNRTIALARRAFGDDSDEPRYIQTVHGAGYRYVGPIEALASEQLPAQAWFAPPSTVRLPARTDVLIGREAQLSVLADRLAGNRAVTVVGPGGMGKTQCVLEAARRAAGGFPDGVWFFDLAPVESAGEWLRTLGAALAMPASAQDTLLSQISTLLRERQALLVLDNCERVAAPLGALVIQLLRSTAALRVLATSQVALNFAGEQLLRLPPLEIPSATELENLDADTIGRCAAVEMIVRRIRAVQPEFELRADNANSIAQICIQLDGMPLALELAAARFSLLSAAQVLERLVQRFRFLGGPAAGRDQRHRSLETLLDWSYALLSPDEERLLNWCAVFVQTWSVETGVGMAAALGHDAERAIDLLAGLVNHSLVSVVPSVTVPRYRLLETVRDYALARLRLAGEEAQARATHMRLVLNMCRAAHTDILAGHMRERVEELAQERSNIAAAIDTSMRTAGGHEEALDICGSLVIFSKGHGDYVTVARWCRDVLSGCAVTETPERARALLTLGVAEMHFAASGARSDSVLPDAARIAAAHGDWWTEAYAHGYYALALANWGFPEEAAEHAAISEARAQDHQDPLLAALAGLARGWISLARGDTHAALRALLAVRDVGADLHQRHFIDMYIALSLFALGEPSSAAREWLRAMELSVAVGNVRGVAGSIEGCGYVACSAGEYASAARLLAAARRIRELTEIPVFNFWRPHQAAAIDRLRGALSSSELTSETQKGLQMRHEDAAKEAQAILWRLAGSPDDGRAQTSTNRPAGS